MIPARSGRLRYGVVRPKTMEEVARAKAAAIMSEWTWGPLQDRFQRANVDQWYVANEGFVGHRPEPLDRETATRVSRHLNDVFHRIVYLMDNPDTALAITNDGPRLLASDIDHETLFRIGRKAP